LAARAHDCVWTWFGLFGTRRCTPREPLLAVQLDCSGRAALLGPPTAAAAPRQHQPHASAPGLAAARPGRLCPRRMPVKPSPARLGAGGWGLGCPGMDTATRLLARLPACPRERHVAGGHRWCCTPAPNNMHTTTGRAARCPPPARRQLATPRLRGATALALGPCIDWPGPRAACLPPLWQPCHAHTHTHPPLPLFAPHALWRRWGLSGSGGG
jgi:hypothetical protein